MEPRVGEIKLAGEVGKAGHHKNIWVECTICKKGRWVPLYRYRKGLQKICKKCYAEIRIIPIKIKTTKEGCTLGGKCLICNLPLELCPNERKEVIQCR